MALKKKSQTKWYHFSTTKRKGTQENPLSPFIYRLFAIISYYSIIVATLPEPTVLPPSRNYFIIVWYILFDFSCFHCSFWLFVLPLFLFAKRNDDSLTTLSYYLFPIVNLGYQMYDITMLYYQQAYAKKAGFIKGVKRITLFIP